MDVIASNLTDLGQFDITVNWDDSKLQYKSIVNGGLLGSTGRTVICSPPDVSAGIATLSCLTIGILPGASGAGVLVTVTFTGAAEGKSDITQDPVSLQTLLGVDLDVNVTNGAVDVDDPALEVAMFHCHADSPVTSNSGDNDGFESNGDDACDDDGAFAVDNQTGTNTNSVCTDTGKDRHIFEDFDIDISAGATVQGVEVRLDVQGSTSSAYLCAELSWDGGNSWTAPRFTFGLGATEKTRWLGSPSDTWGHAWKGSGDLSNGNFQVRLTSVSSVPNANVFLDYVEVHFYYTD